MRRRTLLKTALSSAAVLAAPALVRAEAQTTLRFIPQVDLVYLDPTFTFAYVTRNHSYLVFDTLYGMDGSFKTSPQMAEGHTIENDGKLWNLTLRPGLTWHDGTPVLARDCVASIKRWSARDPFGGTLLKATDELSAPDDRTIRFRLKYPFPLLPDALGKSCSPMCAMMPERLATTDPFKQLTELVGSGPFRFKADERVPGAHNVYERFAGYKPRDAGKSDWTAGPKTAHFDRVVWSTIPDVSTASGALQTGEQDWLENASFDMLPILRQTPEITLTVLDPTGSVGMMGVNHLQPPFDNPAIRRALFGAIDQRDFQEAIVGNDPSLYHLPLGFFCPNTPMASDAGLEPLLGKRDFDRVKAEIKAAGYAGEKVLIMVTSDIPSLKALGDIAADMMRKAGLNVDYYALDWGTMLARRNRKEPVDKGGWSAFVTGWAGLDWLNPAVHIAIRGSGEAGYPGWTTSPRIEQLREDWFHAPDLKAQQAICADMQRQAMIDVPYYPLGQHFQPTAFRKSITGVLNGFPIFWNVRPA
ncbi:MAG TPA: ABC transporter substrate-binding protein [Stellaceae bacterium]|jgi:peptide/nickel transport system substrate-binding protein|nr:ABC transporter substrate-binding protein [Stellaceae bacterium]